VATVETVETVEMAATVVMAEPPTGPRIMDTEDPAAKVGKVETAAAVAAAAAASLSVSTKLGSQARRWLIMRTSPDRLARVGRAAGEVKKPEPATDSTA